MLCSRKVLGLLRVFFLFFFVLFRVRLRIVDLVMRVCWKVFFLVKVEEDRID